MGLEIFSQNFINKHVQILDTGKKYQSAQISKLAIENYLARPGTRDLDRVKLASTSTTIFMTLGELDQMTAALNRILGRSRGRSYSYNKPLSFQYPAGVGLQSVTAVVVVSDSDTDERLYQNYTVKRGSNVGMSLLFP